MPKLPDTAASAREERIEYATIPDVPGLEVLRIDAPARHWRWYHEAYTVGLRVTPTPMGWHYRARMHEFGPSTVCLMEPGEVHAEVGTLPPRDMIRVLFFSPTMVQAAASELGLPAATPHWREAHVGRSDLFRLTAGVHRALEGDATALERETRVVDLLHRFLSEYAEGAHGPAGARQHAGPIGRARDLLNARWADTVRLDDLCAVAGLGRFRLVRAFHAAVGLPPHAYQLHVRVSRARQLIRSGVPLVEVASATGFADQSHLARHFARAFGVSPGRYRRAVR